MYDIKSLENQWVQYRNNKRKPLYVGLLLFFLLLIFITIFSLNKKNSINEKNLTVKPSKVKSINKNKIILMVDKSISRLLENKIETKNLVDSDILLAKIEMKETPISENIPTLPIVKNIPILDSKSIGKIITVEKPKIKKPIVTKIRKKMYLKIKESSSVSAYQDVEKRFMQSHDIDDSLFLAKSYYRRGNYKKSKYWAMETNKVNSSIEDSWLIYIKSKIKLGQKNEAIHILTNYAKKSNSAAAWNLLLKLKK